MTSMMSFLLRKLAARRGLRLVDDRNYPHGMDYPKDFVEFSAQVKEYTQTSLTRLYGVYSAIDYISKNKIPGDVVECGVWRGGSAMMAALTLLSRGDTSRKIYLYDTFEGMPKPAAIDVDHTGTAAEKAWTPDWNFISQEEVESNMGLTNYPNVVCVKGMVEDTIPRVSPDRISLLRLDTDFYVSTLHELNHLYPKLQRGGVLIIDDYGHFQGARAAVDEYFNGRSEYPFMHRLDYTGRLIVKPN